MSDESIANRIEQLVSEERALREAGADPEQAHVRDAETVEHYEQ